MAINNISGQQVVTTNATPATFELGPIADDEVIKFEIHVVARSTTNVAKTWDLRRSAKKNGANAPTFVGSETAVAVHADAGAAAWTIGTALVGTRVLAITLTGAAATTITWDVSGIYRTS